MPRRLLGKLILLSAGLALGCGIITTIPLDEFRFGDPAGVLYGVNHSPYVTGDVIFSHDIHVGLADCESCHPPGTDESNPPLTIQQKAYPSMARCLTCHDGDQASDSCEACHQIERQGRKPSTHDVNFQSSHGREAKALSFQCQLCHVEDGCQGCHATRKPRSHTLRFLRTTHGRLANRDRHACATCHEADFCENCHSRPPPDHTPTFMMTGGHKQVARLRARSCLTCHRFQDDCSECHGG